MAMLAEIVGVALPIKETGDKRIRRTLQKKRI